MVESKAEVDWTTTWHAAVLVSAHRDATCRLCGATAQKAIHDETFARSRGFEFVRP